MNNDVIIRTKNLCCLSGSQYLLNNINWEVRRGEQWIVFGRNGCGKTTLLSIIAGYKKHSSGTLEVFGEPYSVENIFAFRKKIGWISSSFFDKYYTQETALNIVLSGLSATLGMRYAISNTDLKKAKRLLNTLGLHSKIDMPFDVLSKGERQNVLIARAFITSPEVLILDEPGTGLDVMAREYLLSTIKALSETNQTTLIYVTHYPEEILANFDKCLLLRNGTIYKCGNTKELFASTQMSDFLNYPLDISNYEGRFRISIQVESDLPSILADKTLGVPK